MIEHEKLMGLKGALGKEILGYRKLLEACLTQRMSMLAADGSGMQAAMAEQNDVLGECREASSHRLLLVSALSTELGLGESHTLGRLIAALPDGSGELISGEAETMRSLCSKIRELSGRIIRLSEHRMDLLKGDFGEMLRIVRDEAGKIAGENAGDQGVLISTQA